MVRVRLAPSPTGKLHLGTARTALFNFLFAKKNKGKFILRIEDTDRTRSTKEFEKDIIENLKWLGLDWDEFYRQTERLSIYQKYAQKLIQEGKAYYCYCTPSELEKERKEQQKQKLPTKYSGRCRNLTKEQIAKFEKEKRKPAVRLDIDMVIKELGISKIIEFEDIIHGKLHFDLGLEGDFIILKSDGFPIFHFAVVIDDAEMKISHVIRGEDHLSNTPKQILIQKALGFSQPQYAHIPLILNPDKTKMSKRYGATEISEYKKMGYLPEAMLNFLALLGWSPGGGEIYSKDELISKFSLNQVQKSPAIFYKEKLEWVNGEWLRKLRVSDLSKRIRDFGYKGITEKMILIIQERIKRLDEIPFWTDFFFKEIEYNKELLVKELRSDRVGEILKAVLKDFEKISWRSDKIKETTRELAGKFNLKLKDFLYPLRIAITGRSVSPPLFESMEILGKEKCLKRIKKAYMKLKVKS
jgi:glutamyl-tRNA synthetase